MIIATFDKSDDHFRFHSTQYTRKLPTDKCPLVSGGRTQPSTELPALSTRSFETLLPFTIIPGSRGKRDAIKTSPISHAIIKQETRRRPVNPCPGSAGADAWRQALLFASAASRRNSGLWFATSSNSLLVDFETTFVQYGPDETSCRPHA